MCVCLCLCFYLFLCLLTVCLPCVLCAHFVFLCVCVSTACRFLSFYLLVCRPPVCLSNCVSVCLSVSLPVCLSVACLLPVCLLSVCLSPVCLGVRCFLPVCPCGCIFVCPCVVVSLPVCSPVQIARSGVQADTRHSRVLALEPKTGSKERWQPIASTNSIDHFLYTDLLYLLDGRRNLRTTTEVKLFYPGLQGYFGCYFLIVFTCSYVLPRLGLPIERF